MCFMVWKRKLGLAATLGFCLGAYYVHETIYESLFFLTRYFNQGIIEPFNFETHTVTFALIGVFLIYFWKRLHKSILWVPFIMLNAYWLSIGLPISFEVNTPLVNIVEESYTFTFLLGLWGSFK